MVVLALSVLLATTPALPLLAQLPSSTPSSLTQARRLADELRYEEAVVEYQRYLGLSERPSNERARALLELGFIHLLLDDEVNAQRHALAAIELDPNIEPPPNAPAKQQSFIAEVRKLHENRPRLELLSREGLERPEEVAVRLTDPLSRAKSVVLRHSISASGPFYSLPMRCAEEGVCKGFVPPPQNVASYTAWYFIEAQDQAGAPIARAASPEAPLQLAIIQRTPWFKSPYVYAGGAALLIGAGALFFAVNAPEGPGAR